MSVKGKRKFAVFDIDGTLFRSHLFWEVALDLARQEKLHPKLNTHILKLHEDWRKRSTATAFETFDETSITALKDLLADLNPLEYDEQLKKTLTPLLDYVNTYPKKLMEKLRGEDYALLAISGSRMEEVNLFAEYHKFDDWVGQIFHRTADGTRYTGEVTPTFKDKHLTLEKMVKKHDLTYEHSYAVGDTAGDISLLEVVEHPIAYNPNRTLLDAAQKNGWKIVVERKSIAYTLEAGRDGYLLAETD